MELVGTVRQAQTYGDWTRARVEVNRRLVTVVGTFTVQENGPVYRFQGAWDVHPKYGDQFKADLAMLHDPSPATMLLLLAEGVDGIGSVLAARMLEHFKAELKHVLDHEPQRLTEVDGIGPARAQALAAQWEAAWNAQSNLIWLLEQGVAPALAQKLATKFSASVREVVQERPYSLIREAALSWDDIDALGKQMGVAPTDMERQAAALYTAAHAEAQRTGCTRFLPPVREVYRLLGVSQQELPEIAFREIRSTSHLKDEFPLLRGAKEPMALAEYFDAEHCIMDRIEVASAASLEVMSTSTLRGILAGLRLSEAQQDAVRVLTSERFAVLTGGPGTGKTTTVRALLAVFAHMGFRPVLAAPTGMAAKRLTEVTGVQASTIHRLLLQGGMRAPVIVIDEASMLDPRLLQAVLQQQDEATRHGRVILVGDEGQLPSVSPGAVLRDVLRVAASARLTEIFRQAEGSGIPLCAASLREHGEILEEEGVTIVDPEDTAEVVTLWEQLNGERVLRSGLNPHCQLLSPGYKGTFGIHALNRLIQQRRIDGGFLRDDVVALSTSDFTLYWRDRVLLTKNSPTGCVNGDTGILVEVTPSTVVLQLDTRPGDAEGEVVELPRSELLNLLPGYAISVHRSQGSEYPDVIVSLDAAHGPLLERRVLYTALTRARSRVYLMGEPRVLRGAGARGSERDTWLWQLAGDHLEKEV